MSIPTLNVAEIEVVHDVRHEDIAQHREVLIAVPSKDIDAPISSVDVFFNEALSGGERRESTLLISCD